MGARRMYISTTPSKNTVNFYLSLGCTVTLEPDPKLRRLNPRTSTSNVMSRRLIDNFAQGFARD
jgi:hypothetical protein